MPSQGKIGIKNIARFVEMELVLWLFSEFLEIIISLVQVSTRMTRPRRRPSASLRFSFILALMVLIYLAPTHFMLQLPVGDSYIQLDAWAMYAMPFPLVLLSPFTAGLTFVTRNYAREEHAFVWSDFWENVKGNWKYFLLNGFIVYVVYVVLSFSAIYYYNGTTRSWFFYIPFWLCLVLALFFLFAQYYLPVMFVTFDLKFRQAYRPSVPALRDSTQWACGFPAYRPLDIPAVLAGQFLHQLHGVPRGGQVSD